MKAGTTVDRYVVEGVAGSGAVGTVYRVRHASLGTQHALKVVASGSPAARLRFEREARMQASLRHPNIVRVTDVLEVEGQPALVAEFVGGPNLAEVIADGSLTLDQAVELFTQIVEGVAAAHEQGIVHRDLKPHNVLIDHVDGRMVARVSDFGIAGWLDKEQAASLTRTGIAMGTPAYMAPEQHEDAGRVDGRADVWSLGCILFELTTGRRPFDGTTLVKLALQASMADYPPPSSIKPELPASLDALVADCLVADPAGRLASCQELLARLVDVVDQLPVYDSAGAVVFPPTLDSAHAMSRSASPVLASRSHAQVYTTGDLTPQRGSKRPLALGLFLLLGAVGLGVGALRGGGDTAETEAAGAGSAGDGPVATASPADSTAVQPDTIMLNEAGPPQDTAATAEPVAPAGSTRAEVEPAAASTAAQPTPVVASSGSDRVIADPSASTAAVAPTGTSAPNGSTTSGADDAVATSFRGADTDVKLRLVGGDGSFQPGPVPPGRYLVRATFPGKEERDAGYVSVRPDQVTVISCDAVFMQCRRQ